MGYHVDGLGSATHPIVEGWHVWEKPDLGVLRWVRSIDVSGLVFIRAMSLYIIAFIYLEMLE